MQKNIFLKIVVLLILLDTSVYANYEKAEEYYKQAQYKKTIAELKSSISEYGDVRLHLLWAKSAQALGKTSEAMSAYERVLLIDDKNKKASIALLNIYKKTGRTILLEGLDKNKSTLKTSLMLGSGYDTNINISADGGILDDYGIANGALSTLFSQAEVQIQYRYLFEKHKGLYTQATLRSFYQNNSDAHYYDMLLLGTDIAIGYKNARYNFSLPLSYEKLRYLNTDLLTQTTLKPQVEIKLQKNILLNLNTKYAKREYQDKAYTSLGDSSYGSGIDVYYIFSQNYMNFHSEYEKYLSRFNKHPKFIDREELTLAYTLVYQPAAWLSTQLNYSYKLAYYKENIYGVKNANTSAKREDKMHQLQLKFSHSFLKNYKLFLLGRFVKNDSTNPLSRYKKSVGMLGLSANY